jgi:shikimate kinase
MSFPGTERFDAEMAQTLFAMTRNTNVDSFDTELLYLPVINSKSTLGRAVREIANPTVDHIESMSNRSWLRLASIVASDRTENGATRFFELLNRLPDEKAAALTIIRGELGGISAISDLRLISQIPRRAISLAAKFSLRWNGGPRRSDSLPSAPLTARLQQPAAIAPARERCILAIVGASGAGKTTLSRYVAKQIGLRLISTDELVFGGTQNSSSGFIQEKGVESYFDKLSATLNNLDLGRSVLDFGALALLDESIRSWLVQSAEMIVCLTAAPNVLLSRIRSNQKHGARTILTTQHESWQFAILEARQEIALSVADKELQNDADTNEGSATARLIELLNSEVCEVTESEAFEPYLHADSGYYVKPSGLLLRAINLFSNHFFGRIRACDLGSGTGRNGLFLGLGGMEVDCFDISRAGCNYAKFQARALGLGRKVKVHCRDLTTTHLPRQSYDLLCAFTILDHLDLPCLPPVRQQIVESMKRHGLLIASAFLTSDPGARSDGGEISETARYVKHYFEPGELRELFVREFEILDYREHEKVDTSHGPAHHHVVAELIAQLR